MTVQDDSLLRLVIVCKSTTPRAEHTKKMYDSTFYHPDTDLLHTHRGDLLKVQAARTEEFRQKYIPNSLSY